MRTATVIDASQRCSPEHDAASGEVAGFARIRDNIPEPTDDDLVGPYFLWKLVIDERYQRQGYAVPRQSTR